MTQRVSEMKTLTKSSHAVSVNDGVVVCRFQRRQVFGRAKELNVELRLVWQGLQAAIGELSCPASLGKRVLVATPSIARVTRLAP